MEPISALNTINWWAIIVATIAYFLVGSLWYTLLFGRQWIRLQGLKPEEIEGSNPMLFVASFMVELTAVAFLALFMNAAGVNTAFWGFLSGFGMGVLLFALTTNNFFFTMNRSAGLHLINNGFHLVALSIAGLILGVWQG